MSYSLKIKLVADGLKDLLFPQYCVHCKRPCRDDALCMHCRLISGRTDHFSIQDNEVIQRTRLRIELEFAAALYYYTKKGPIQELVQQLKYKGMHSIGYREGLLFGTLLIRVRQIKRPDFIVPVPVHWRRKMKRGYNQTVIFAKGIRKVTGIRIREDILVKTKGSRSQTKKNRQSRFEQIMDTVCLKKPGQVEGKCILLVDDVMTTGATVEAAVIKLNQAGCHHIQLGLIALAIN